MGQNWAENRMIARKNVELLVEVKLAKKKWGPKFKSNGLKLHPILDFFVFFSSLVH